MKYKFIQTYRSEFSVEKMCQVLAVTKSGYYHWVYRGPSKREQENRQILAEIKQIYKDKKKEVYGAPRIYGDLKEKGISCGVNRVATIMKNNGIKAKTKKKFKVTTDSNHKQPVAPNLLEQKFVADAPNKVWLTDITYVWTKEGWLYLATILDVFSRKIVGWSMNNRLTRDLVINALNQAYWRRKPEAGLILHSDRGCQYASTDFRRLLEQYKIRQSMSGKGNCYDNAMMESFFHTLKIEHVYWETFLTRDQARQSIFEYIEVFYNRERRHSGIQYFSPSDYEMIFMLKCA